MPEPLNLEVRDMSDFKNTNDIDFTGDLEAYRPEEIPALTLDPVSEELPGGRAGEKDSGARRRDAVYAGGAESDRGIQEKDRYY